MQNSIRLQIDEKYYYMASVTSGEMKHCDWLLTGPDFPVFPRPIYAISIALRGEKS